jgi:hypothetical protein
MRQNLVLVFRLRIIVIGQYLGNGNGEIREAMN